MYQTVTRSDFHDAFRRSRPGYFSYEGLNVLYEYLTEMENFDDKDTWIELDVIAICCDYAEDTIENVLKEYNLSDLEELMAATTVLEVNEDRIIYLQF